MISTHPLGRRGGECYTLTVDWPDGIRSGQVTCDRDTLQRHLGTLSHLVDSHPLHGAPVLIEIRLAGTCPAGDDTQPLIG